MFKTQHWRACEDVADLYFDGNVEIQNKRACKYIADDDFNIDIEIHNIFASAASEDWRLPWILWLLTGKVVVLLVALPVVLPVVLLVVRTLSDAPHV